jgi:hypothetical protein
MPNQTVDSNTVFPIDETTPALAGPGQPLHLDYYGQGFYPNIADPTGPYLQDPTSLHPGKYLLANSLNVIVQLLIKSLNVMQSVAVSQAGRLNFLTQWQQAYTSRMNNVHTFAQNNGDAYVAGSDSTSGTNRQSLNQTNSAYIQADTSNNNIIADAAKSLQTNINQTQDSVNQQSNMLTSLLQQYQAIIASIYK